MYTLLIAVIIGSALGYLLWILVGSILLSTIVAAVAVLGVNLLSGRYFTKKLTAIMEGVEKDLRSERFEPALEKLRGAYRYSKWQFLMKKQLDSQIGSILYVRKRFDEALPYLQNSFSKNWAARCMLAAYHYRTKNYEAAFKVMDETVAANKKEAFPYSLYAYFLTEQGKEDKAIQVLSNGVKKIPLDERLSSELDAVKNRKKVKIQNYGALWMQLHIGKAQDGARPYQALLMNQRARRR